MERLLTIKEAAKWLKVSEMTIRRWTNGGLLRCYRIGARRARRFKAEDLLAFLQREQAPPKVTPVAFGFTEGTVPGGAHMTHLSAGEKESLAVAMDFVIQVLGTDETVCLVAPDDKLEAIAAAARRHGAQFDQLRKAGRLYLNTGMATPEQQLHYLQEISTRASGRIRIFGDMLWTKERGWPVRELGRLEHTVHTSPRPADSLVLCQYLLDRFSGAEIMTAVETHTHHIYHEKINANPYE